MYETVRLTENEIFNFSDSIFVICGYHFEEIQEEDYFFTNSSVNRYCKVIPVVVESYTRVFDKTFLVEHQPGLEGLHPYLKLVVDLGVPLPTGVTGAHYAPIIDEHRDD